MSNLSIPRPVLFAVLGAVVIVAAFLLLNKKSDDSSDSASTPTAPPAATNPSTSSSKPDSKVQPDSKSSTQSTTKPVEETQVDITKLPKNVKKALDQNKIVTVLFWRKAGVEDRYMQTVAAIYRGCSKGQNEVNVRGQQIDLPLDRKACNQLRKAALFQPGVRALPRWLRITGVNSLELTPSYIVINTKGRADFQTGFIDAGTMLNSIYNAQKKLSGGGSSSTKNVSGTVKD